MITLERYLVRQAVIAGSLSLVVLLGVVIALFFTELLGDAAGGSVPGHLVAVLLALRIPEALVLVAPLALMTGMLLAIGSMGQQSELAVMRSAGLSSGSVFAAGGRVAFGWAALMLGVTGWLSPLAERVGDEVLSDAARSATIAGLQPGQFQAFAGDRLVVYVAGVDNRGGRLEDVFIRRQADGMDEITTASRGVFRVNPETGERFLTLFDGGQVSQDAGGNLVRHLRFARNDIRLPSVTRRAGDAGWSAAYLPGLLAAGDADAWIELQWRLAPVLAMLLLAALAVPLAVVDPRQGRHGRIVLALVIYLGYSNAIHLCLLAMQQGRLPATLGLWPVHGVVLICAAWLWRRLYARW